MLRASKSYTFNGRRRFAVRLLMLILALQPAPAAFAAAQDADPAGSSPPATGTPKAVIVDPEFDFGTVWAGEGIVLRHSFLLKNVGDGDLHIGVVKTSCVCTLAGDYPPVLKPGESCQIPFEMESTRLVGPEGGRFAKSAAVVTNDPVQSHAEILLTGYARFHVQAPAAINFGPLREDAVVEKVATLVNNTEQPLKLTLPRMTATPESPFVFELTEKEPGRVFELKATTVPPLGEGRVAADLEIETNLPVQPTLKIPVFGTVPKRIEVHPSFLVFNPQRLTIPIVFNNNGAKAASVTSATTDDPTLKLEVIENEAGRKYTVEVTFPSRYVSAREERRVTLHTDDATFPKIDIPIRPLTSVQKKRPAEELAGGPAPEFEFTTREGVTVSHETLYSHDAVVLTFWAADCPFSKRALPRLEKVRQQYADQNVRFINIAQTMRRKYTDEQIDVVADALEMRAEQVFDQGNTLGPRFKADSFPTIFVLSRTGEVAGVSIGNSGALEQEVGGVLKKLTQGG